MHFETRERQYNAAFLHQDRFRGRSGCHEEIGRQNKLYSSCTVGSSDLIRKLLCPFRGIGNRMDYDLGYIDLEEKTLQPLENPFGPKV